MEINIFSQSGEQRWSRYASNSRTISKRTQWVLKLEGFRSASVIFMTPQIIHEMNKDYRDTDWPTDIISFAMRDGESVREIMEGREELGNVFINIEAIPAQAADCGHSLQKGVCFLLTRGLLYLLGYDHMTPGDGAVIFQLQDVILGDVVPKKIWKWIPVCTCQSYI